MNGITNRQCLTLKGQHAEIKQEETLPVSNKIKFGRTEWTHVSHESSKHKVEGTAINAHRYKKKKITRIGTKKATAPVLRALPHLS